MMIWAHHPHGPHSWEKKLHFEFPMLQGSGCCLFFCFGCLLCFLFVVSAWTSHSSGTRWSCVFSAHMASGKIADRQVSLCAGFSISKLVD